MEICKRILILKTLKDQGSLIIKNFDQNILDKASESLLQLVAFQRLIHIK